MSNQDLVLAFKRVLHQLDVVLQEFTKAIPPSDHYDTAALTAGMAAHLDNQAKMAALMLLPLRYPELGDKVAHLQRMYAKVVGTPETPWVGTPRRSQQYEAAINTTVELILTGEPFKNYEIAHRSGVSKNRLRVIFEHGDDELRNLAFQRITATVLAFVGVTDTPA